MSNKTSASTAPKTPKATKPKAGRPADKSEEVTSVYTAFRCPPDILARARAAATKQRRSLSNYIVNMLDKQVD